MPVIPINFLAVFAAAVANMIVGFLWFGPLFGKQWIAMMGWTPQQVETAKKTPMGKTYVFAFIGSLIMSYVLAHSLIFASAYLNVNGAMAGVQAGFWNWLGFVMPVLLGTVLWEGRSWKLWGLQVAYYLVTLVIMGVILAMWM